jgi:hypothetical protein
LAADHPKTRDIEVTAVLYSCLQNYKGSFIQIDVTEVFPKPNEIAVFLSATL